MADPTPLTILVVDDDEVKRYTLGRILRRAGFAVHEAATGADALRRAAEKPDLIILDVGLPDLDGFEVCRRVKADPATAAIPVLHVSARHVESEDRAHGLDSGADGYLTDVVEPVELLATVRALLRARQAEEAARAAARQWQSTFDAIRDGVGLLDRDGRLVRGNLALARMLGGPGAGPVGRPLHDLLPAPTGAPPQPPPREARDLVMGERWFHLTVDPITDDDGSPRGAVCILSDVTDRKRMEEELKRRADGLTEADRQKDEFLAMLAHELRNPLAPIRNALEVIRLDPDPSAVARTRELAERQVAHLARLVDDLLDVSRITRGKIQLRKGPVDLSAVVTHAVESTRAAVESSGHRLTVSLPPEPLGLEGDPTRLEQVFANLLNNAAKYTEPGGSIDLSAEREGGEAVIRVRDTGIGLSAEMLPRVFDLFAQADRTLARAQGGLGIGLTLVRSLVEMHGGRVEARSDGPGRGSVFTVRLPVAGEPAPRGPEPPPPAAGPPPRPLRLLVVDDNTDSAKSLARVLKLWGHEVRVAHNGPEAIEAAAAHPTDLVLLDIGLPGMDGYEVARQLRARSETDGLVLIALTGYGQDEDRRRSLDVGFNRHLTKPVSLDELQRLLADPEALRRGKA